MLSNSKKFRFQMKKEKTSADDMQKFTRMLSAAKTFQISLAEDYIKSDQNHRFKLAELREYSYDGSNSIDVVPFVYVVLCNYYTGMRLMYSEFFAMEDYGYAISRKEKLGDVIYKYMHEEPSKYMSVLRTLPYDINMSLFYDPILPEVVVDGMFFSKNPLELLYVVLKSAYYWTVYQSYFSDRVGNDLEFFEGEDHITAYKSRDYTMNIIAGIVGDWCAKTLQKLGYNIDKLFLYSRNSRRLIEKSFGGKESPFYCYLHGKADVETFIMLREKGRNELGCPEMIYDILVEMAYGIDKRLPDKKILFALYNSFVARTFSSLYTYSRRRWFFDLAMSGAVSEALIWHGHKDEIESEIQALKIEIKGLHQSLDVYRNQSSKLEKLSKERDELRKKLACQNDRNSLLAKQIDKLNKGETLVKLEAERAKTADLENSLEYLETLLSKKTHECSLAIKRAKKAESLVMQENEEGIELSAFETQMQDAAGAIDISTKIEALKGLKVLLCGGPIGKATELRELGIDARQYQDFDSSDAGFQFEVLVIMTHRVGHKLVYFCNKRCEELGAARLYFSGSNTENLISEIYDYWKER